jgi:hypothetical protein
MLLGVIPEGESMTDLTLELLEQRIHDDDDQRCRKLSEQQKALLCGMMAAVEKTEATQEKDVLDAFPFITRLGRRHHQPFSHIHTGGSRNPRGWDNQTYSSHGCTPESRSESASISRSMRRLKERGLVHNGCLTMAGRRIAKRLTVTAGDSLLTVTSG